jgi:tetratricopeptide (TPR) repeat protein
VNHYRQTDRTGTGAVLLAAVLVAGCGGAAPQVEKTSLLLDQPPAETTPAPTGTGADPAVAPGSASASTTAVFAGGPVDPNRAENAAREGMAMAREGRLESAREKFREAAGAGSTDPVFWYNFAVAELKAGDPMTAEAALQRAVELTSGESARPLDLLCDVLIGRGRADLLTLFLDQVRDRFPESINIRIALVRAKTAMNRSAEAIRDAQEILKKDEANVRVMKAMARAYMATERYDAATFILTQALELADGKADGQIYDLLGQMLLRKGETQKAIGQFLKAVELDPRLADAHNNLGVLYHQAGDFDAAIAEFTAAVHADPFYSEAYLNMGNSLRKKREFDKAIGALREALRLDPQCVDCHFNLGVAELENKPDGVDEPTHYRRAAEHFNAYKDVRRQAKRDEDADKYLEEAVRMADILEKQQRELKAAPPPVETPAPTETPAPVDGAAPIETPPPAPADGTAPADVTAPGGVTP